VSVHAGSGSAAQDRAVHAGRDCSLQCSSDRGWERDEGDLVALTVDAEHSVSVGFTEVFDVGAGGFEDPKAEESEHADQGEAVGIG
jgi:hypothetical protein